NPTDLPRRRYRYGLDRVISGPQPGDDAVTGGVGGHGSKDHRGTAARGELMNPPPPPRAGPQTYLNLAIAAGIGVVDARPGRDEGTLRVGRNDRVDTFEVGTGQRLDRRPARLGGGRQRQRGPGDTDHDRRGPQGPCPPPPVPEPTAPELLPAPQPHAG